MLARDLGTVMTVAGADIHTSYYSGSVSSTLYGGRPAKFRAILQFVTKTASACTDATVKFEASSDGTTWFDVKSLDDDGTYDTEHNWTLTAASTQQQSLQVDGQYPYLRLNVESAGVGATGDSFTATASAA